MNEQREPMWTAVTHGDMTCHIRSYLELVSSDESQICGVYYFGIIAAACHFESVLEDFTTSWCASQKDESSAYLNRLMERIGSDVSRATGLDAWKNWMHTLFGISIVEVVGPDWNALSILFKLRNQLAHGRTTKIRMYWDSEGRFVGLTTEESGYKGIFKYLIDHGVVSVTTEPPRAELLLTKAVALHFAEAVERSLCALKSVPELSELRERIRLIDANQSRARVR